MKNQWQAKACFYEKFVKKLKHCNDIILTQTDRSAYHFLKHSSKEKTTFIHKTLHAIVFEQALHLSTKMNQPRKQKGSAWLALCLLQVYPSPAAARKCGIHMPLGLPVCTKSDYERIAGYMTCRKLEYGVGCQDPGTCRHHVDTTQAAQRMVWASGGHQCMVQAGSMWLPFTLLGFHLASHFGITRRSDPLAGN